MIEFEINGRAVKMSESYAPELAALLDKSTDKGWGVMDVISQKSREMSAEDRKVRQAAFDVAQTKRLAAEAKRAEEEQAAMKKQLQAKLDALEPVDVEGAVNAAKDAEKAAKAAEAGAMKAKGEGLVEKAKKLVG